MTTQRKTFWKDIVIAGIVSYALGAILFPERFIQFNATFVDYTDSMLSYAGAFYITNALLHGGVQLFDRFDQMPMTFFHLNFAMYKITNVLTALVYALCLPFVKWPAQFFHFLFSFIFISATLMIRIISVYALLSIFVSGRWMRIGATVWVSLVMSAPFMMGLSTNIIYSLFPLFLYYLLTFVRDFRSKDFLMMLFVWAYCIGTDVFCGLGYLYQAMHFVILPAIGYVVICRRKQGLQWIKSIWHKNMAIKVGGIGLTLLLMIGPTVLLALSNWKDYEFGLDNSRMQNPLSISQYFARPAAWAPQGDFLMRSFDFTENLWSLSWVYLGGFTIFLICLGMVAIKDRRKWILIAAAILFFYINCPRSSAGLGGLAHWINALTNPLKFLPRSYHMSCALLLPFVLAPLGAAGMQWIWQQRNKDNVVFKMAIGLFFICASAVFMQLPMDVKKLLALQGMGVLAVWMLCTWQGRRPAFRFAVMGMLVLLLASDAWGASRYVRGLLDTVLTTPRPILARPELGLVNMDYQNPAILPWRHNFSLMTYQDKDIFLFESSANMPGIVFRYTNLTRYYQPVSNYLPRHKSFAQWHRDGGVMFYYAQKRPQMIFMAPYAVSAGEDIFRQVLLKGLGRDVAVIEGAPGLSRQIPDVVPSAEEPLALKGLLVLKEKIQWEMKGKLRIGMFKVPADLSFDEASTFLTSDQDRLSLVVEAKKNKPFVAAQGDLVVPMTFDVNNMRTGWVCFSLAIDQEIPEKLVLMYPPAAGAQWGGLYKNTMDEIGFTYTAKQKGWLIIHEPYDVKWKVRVAGKSTDFYTANNRFMGTPITHARHQLELSSWPHTPLRWMLAVSVLISAAALFFILQQAGRRVDEE